MMSFFSRHKNYLVVVHFVMKNGKQGLANVEAGWKGKATPAVLKDAILANQPEFESVVILNWLRI